MDSPLTLSLADPNLMGSIKFMVSGDRLVLTIKPDGTLEKGPDFNDDDEASRAFFRVLADGCPGFVAALKRRREAAEQYKVDAESVLRPRVPTEAMLNAARDWSLAKYGKGIGNDAAVGCWQAMFDAWRADA